MELLQPVKVIFNTIISVLDQVPPVRVALGFLLVFFIPGFAWTLVFFKELKPLERIALSFGLSIAIVPLSIIVMNVLLKVPLTTFSTFLMICLVTAVPLGIYYLRRHTRHETPDV